MAATHQIVQHHAPRPHPWHVLRDLRDAGILSDEDVRSMVMAHKETDRLALIDIAMLAADARDAGGMIEPAAIEQAIRRRHTLDLPDLPA